MLAVRRQVGLADRLLSKVWLVSKVWLLSKVWGPAGLMGSLNWSLGQVEDGVVFNTLELGLGRESLTQEGGLGWASGEGGSGGRRLLEALAWSSKLLRPRRLICAGCSLDSLLRGCGCCTLTSSTASRCALPECSTWPGKASLQGSELDTTSDEASNGCVGEGVGICCMLEAGLSA